jgi:DnaJ-class molecular chaperone
MMAMMKSTKHSRLLKLLTIALLWMSLLCPCASIMTRSVAMQELGITDAKFTEKDLKGAYRKRSLETHPDKGGSNDEFVRVAEAYNVLSGGGGDSSSKFGGFDGTGSEEAMGQAEDMFFDMFEEFMDGQIVDLLVDKIFGDPAALTWSQNRTASVVKFFARQLVTQLENMLTSDSISFNVNGQTMTGADMKQWREKMRKRKAVKGKRKTDL